MKRIYACLALLPASLLLFPGCNSGEGGANQLSTNAVTGKVTMGGAPVADATVTFSPVGEGIPAAFGRTNAQGIYTLTTYVAGDGAAKGSFKVMVSKSAPAGPASSAPAHDPTGQGGGSSMPQHQGARGGGPAAGGGSLLPEKYASAKTTPLEKEVIDGDNTIDIEL